MNTQRAINQKSSEKRRLVGWLISYALDESGVYFELRAGRTLISSENSSRKDILAFQDSSISAPHAAIFVDPKTGVILQDIFSDAGTFITKNGAREEKALFESAELSHGDWVRIGDNIRFQVCLLDGPRR